MRIITKANIGAVAPHLPLDIRQEKQRLRLTLREAGGGVCRREDKKWPRCVNHFGPGAVFQPGIDFSRPFPL
jgi:hypothetical protein